MLALCTSTELTVVDPLSLKSASTSSIPCSLPLCTAPTASYWFADELYLAAGNLIQKYDPGSNKITNIYSSSGSVSCLLARDTDALVFAADNKIHFLDHGQLSQSLTTHSNTITSIAISNDSSLLASTSSTTVHVHNISIGTHSVLRGIPVASISTCVFHPHNRTRLLVGTGKQLVVYDTTRPSLPSKTISMNESCSGSIIAVSCSPFSKTLVACCTSGGHVGLIDLEKEKG
jgi:protein NEDD1